MHDSSSSSKHGSKPPARSASTRLPHTSASPPPLSSPPSSIPPSPVPVGTSGSAHVTPFSHPKPSLPASQSHHNLSRSISQSHQRSSSPPNSTSSSSPTAQPPNLGGRRSSFGLNFLSTFSSSMRTSSTLQPPPSPTESPHTFMSNSPTIANLNSYASTTLHDEAVASRRRGENSNSNTNSESEFTSEPRLASLVNSGSATDLNNTTQVGISNDSNDPSTEEDGQNNISEHPETNNLELEAEIHAENAINGNNDVEDRANGMDKDGFFSVRLTPIIDHSSAASGLYFSPIIRKIKPDSSITIGRYTEKNKAAAHAPQGSSAPIVFKSKVVSRTHALFQCKEDGQWFLKDSKSSSGTFLNHIRLSPASQESTLMPLIDGDIIQLGMDYRGGTEEVYRCVKMRCEFNKSWQRKVNQFNLEIHKKLKNLQISTDDAGAQENKKSVTLPIPGGANSKEELSECAICLMKIDPCQALFLSPCSHAWHYKCIRPIIIKSYPQFYCPNCRTMCDLETDLDEDD